MLVAAASPAWAADPAAQAAGAALFQEAKQLAGAGDWQHACPKFVEAQRLFPTTGTLLNIGNCYEKLGKLASAWGAFKEAEVMARNLNDVEREQEASRRAQALSPQLAKLAINVPPATRVPGFELRRDGTVIGEGQWGAALPVDRGQHTIEASAPGRKVWSTWVRVETNGSSVTVEVPALEVAPVADGGEPRGAGWGAQRIVGATIAGSGLIGLVIGATLGGLAIAKNNASKEDCRPNEPAICNQAGFDKRLAAGRMADASTAMFIGGGIALAGGAVLFFTAPKPAASKSTGVVRLGAQPMVSERQAGLSLTGWW
ncbi:MAG: hypothetical protein QM820_32415 [Minicystis sp.]